MKKQILILALFVMATFANVSKLYGQTTCTDGPLNPVAGVAYDYEVSVAGAGYDGAGTYVWYVTTNNDILNTTHVANNAGEIIATGNGAYDSNKTGATSNTLKIEWTSQAIVNGQTKPYFLVVKYSQLNSNGACTSENIKVWEVKPINKFLLAINTFSGAVGADGKFCPGDIVSAIVTPSSGVTPASIAYDYGTSILYAQITPSNYTGNWTPSFQITGLDANQSITSVSWDTAPTGTFANTTTVSGGVYTASSNATSKYDGSSSIYVKIVVANGTYEGPSASTINIAVDGEIPVTTGTPLPDVVSASDCTAEAVFGKNVNVTLLARPNITETKPAATSFIQP